MLRQYYEDTIKDIIGLEVKVIVDCIENMTQVGFEVNDEVVTKQLLLNQEWIQEFETLGLSVLEFHYTTKHGMTILLGEYTNG